MTEAVHSWSCTIVSWSQYCSSWTHLSCKSRGRDLGLLDPVLHHPELRPLYLTQLRLQVLLALRLGRTCSHTRHNGCQPRCMLRTALHDSWSAAHMQNPPASLQQELQDCQDVLHYTNTNKRLAQLAWLQRCHRCVLACSYRWLLTA